MSIGKFGNAPKAAAPKAAPGPRKSRWEGLTGGTDRAPMMQPGVYRVRVDACEIKRHPVKGTESFHGTVTIAEAGEGAGSNPGERCNVLYMVGNPAGQANMFRFIRAAAGFDSDDAFYAGLDASYIDAVLGDANEHSANGMPLEGRLVDVQVTRGKDTESGDFFREYQWSAVEQGDAS